MRLNTRRTNILSDSELEKAKLRRRGRALSFEKALDLFIQEGKTRNLRPYTLNYYQQELNNFKFLLEAQNIITIPNRITSKMIKENVVEYLKGTKKLKVTTINTRLRAIRAFFNFLHKEGHIINNPMKGIKLVRDRRKVVPTFSLEQIHDLLDQPDLNTFTGFRDYTLMLLLLETGIRVNELSGIHVRDVSFDDSMLLVRKTKGNKERTVPLTPIMLDQMKKYLTVRGEGVGCEHLFITIDNTPLTVRQIQNRIRKYGVAANITNVRCSPHTFRHTFAKMSVKQGAGVFELQQILGHTTMDMVRVYVNLYSEDVKGKHLKFSPLNNINRR
ncbi:tyrosine-type recombinase/integrase [Bacillus sonorensis]|uniref:tyrosine-type recombinase/integrase n=1 Tax=Bacillus sonorensis TaxID=119858 RepID=UPI002280F16B|nr:tyrosine-type recombinase/integrase [Bacillus sonorensis]MCY8026413.1 tyrosine-type recombinase/integrase [Bacillus sonorensis]